MKRKIVSGILVLAIAVLSACGMEDDGKVTSLEPHSLESDNVADATGGGSGSAIGGGGSDSAAGTPGGGESDSAAGTLGGGGSDSVAGASGGGGSGSAAAGGASSAGGKSDVLGNGSGEAGNTAEMTASGQDTLGSDISTTIRTAAESLSDTDRKIYLQAVNEGEGDAKGYSLIYLDGDNTPELVVHDRGNDSYSIYTVKDQAIFCMADSLYTVELTYFERCGVIASFSRWNGGGDEGGYGSTYDQVSRDRTLTNDDQAVLSYSYNATYNEKGEYTGTGVIEYFYMGQQIGEAAYQEKMASLGIAEGEDQLCMEGSCDREEIIALLSR